MHGMRLPRLHCGFLLRRISAHGRARPLLLLALALLAASTAALCACMADGEPIDKPDEYTHVYEADEKYIVRAVSQIFKEKSLGQAPIHAGENEVTSDWIVQGEWRTRGIARIRRIDWREREVKLSILTEKKTPSGWQLRRLLGKEQYEKIFNAVDSQIYREMYKTE